MSLLNVIKSAGMQAVDAANPVNILFGTVESIDPVSVNVDQRFTLTSEFLIVPERLIRYVVDLTHTHQYTDVIPGGATVIKNTQEALEPLIVRTGLEVGDTVILIRIQGGQKYLIVDKVVME